MVEITDHADARTFLISLLSGGNLTLSGTIANGSVSYRIVKCPKFFNPDASTAEAITPTAGFIPYDAGLVQVYRDRLVWTNGRQWYMSRQGDIGDYDYSADLADAGRAVAGELSDTGQPADPVIALVPGGFDYLVFFSEDTTWVLRGDPAMGGRLFNVSRTVGCVDSAAWCYGPQGEIYFLSKHGLCVLPPDMSQPPMMLSEKKLPKEMQGADRQNYSTTLAFDQQHRTVGIFITPRTGGSGSHWLFNTDTQSFWRLEFANPDHQPVEAISFSGTPARPRRIVMACRDGYVRQINGSSDDGTAITSWVVMGPYKMSDVPSVEGLLNELAGTLSIESGTVTLTVFTGESAQEAVSKATSNTAPVFSTTFSSGRSRTIRPRVRGLYFCVRLTATAQWSFEGFSADVVPMGRRRK